MLEAERDAKGKKGKKGSKGKKGKKGKANKKGKNKKDPTVCHDDREDNCNRSICCRQIGVRSHSILSL